MLTAKAVVSVSKFSSMSKYGDRFILLFVSKVVSVNQSDGVKLLEYNFG